MSRFVIRSRFRRGDLPPGERDRQIDLGLAVLCACQSPGQVFTHAAIAAATGWSHAGSHAVEGRALKTIRKKLAALQKEGAT